MLNGFPYSDSYTLNLDWMLAKLKESEEFIKSVQKLRNISAVAHDGDEVGVTVEDNPDTNGYLLDFTIPKGVDGTPGSRIMFGHDVYGSIADPLIFPVEANVYDVYINTLTYGDYFGNMYMCIGHNPAGETIWEYKLNITGDALDVSGFVQSVNGKSGDNIALTGEDIYLIPTVAGVDDDDSSTTVTDAIDSVRTNLTSHNTRINTNTTDISSINNRVITLENASAAANPLKMKWIESEIPAAAWSAAQSGDGYTNTVTIAGLPAGSHPIIDVLAETQDDVDNFNLIGSFEVTAANSITFNSYTDVPDADIAIGLLVVYTEA